MSAREIHHEPVKSRKRPGVGRPTREEQARRREELLEVALDMFLDHGFESTTTEDIASRIGMSKRTIYARHKDKAALFHAAVDRAIERYTIPYEKLEACRSDRLEETLAAVARLRIANISTDVAVKLQRILSAHSYRFPDLFQEAFARGAGQTISFLEERFRFHEARGEIVLANPRQAASAFLSLAVGGPARMVITGSAFTPAEIDKQVEFSVDLFMNGIRKR